MHHAFEQLHHHDVVTGSRAGVLPIKSLVGSKQGSRYLAPNGEWLGTPDAALMATSDGIEQTVLLSLTNPVFHENEQVGIPQSAYRFELNSGTAMHEVGACDHRSLHASTPCIMT